MVNIKRKVSASRSNDQSNGKWEQLSIKYLKTKMFYFSENNWKCLVEDRLIFVQ